MRYLTFLVFSILFVLLIPVTATMADIFEDIEDEEEAGSEEVDIFSSISDEEEAEEADLVCSEKYSTVSYFNDKHSMRWDCPSVQIGSWQARYSNFDDPVGTCTISGASGSGQASFMKMGMKYVIVEHSALEDNLFVTTIFPLADSQGRYAFAHVRFWSCSLCENIILITTIYGTCSPM